MVEQPIHSLTPLLAHRISSRRVKVVSGIELIIHETAKISQSVGILDHPIVLFLVIFQVIPIPARHIVRNTDIKGPVCILIDVKIYAQAAGLQGNIDFFQ